MNINCLQIGVIIPISLLVFNTNNIRANHANYYVVDDCNETSPCSHSCVQSSLLSIIFITLINKTQTHKFVIRFPVSASNLQRERILQFPLSSRLSCIGDSLKWEGEGSADIKSDEYLEELIIIIIRLKVLMHVRSLECILTNIYLHNKMYHGGTMNVF